MKADSDNGQVGNGKNQQQPNLSSTEGLKPDARHQPRQWHEKKNAVK